MGSKPDRIQQLPVLSNCITELLNPGFRTLLGGKFDRYEGGQLGLAMLKDNMRMDYLIKMVNGKFRSVDFADAYWRISRCHQTVRFMGHRLLPTIQIAPNDNTADSLRQFTK